MRGLAGKIAIVTGATGGIGRAIAERLAREGVNLCVTGRDASLEHVADALSAFGTRIVPVRGDLSQTDTADQIVDATIAELGTPQLLVNNAGFSLWENALEAKAETYEAVFNLNVRGSYLLASRAAREMVADGGGSVVFIASVSGLRGEEEGAVYNSSKAAVATLAKSFALDLARKNVRVNAIAPGWIRSAATEEALADGEQWGKHRVHVPLDRAGDPSEVASLAAFLLSDEASYITGAVIPVDGGQLAGFRSGGWEAVEHVVERGSLAFAPADSAPGISV